MDGLSICGGVEATMKSAHKTYLLVSLLSLGSMGALFLVGFVGKHGV